MRQTDFFVIMGFFLPFYHPRTHLPNDPKNLNLNAWRYYPFIYTCVPWMKIIWYMVPENIRCNRQKCSTFWAIFFLSAPWQPRKSKFNKEILSVYIFAPQITIIWSMVPETWSATDRNFCHSGPFFALLPTMDPENQNFEKIKKHLKILLFYKCVL